MFFGTAIAYRSGSQVSEIKGYENPGRSKNKNATVIRLNISGKEVVVATAHLSGITKAKGVPENLITAKKVSDVNLQMYSKIRDNIAGGPAIFGGDFNTDLIKVFNNPCLVCDESERKLYSQIHATEFTDSTCAHEETPTTCHFDYDTAESPALIDAIFVKGFKIKSVNIQKTSCDNEYDPNGVYNQTGDINYPSDHRWVMASIIENWDTAL